MSSGSSRKTRELICARGENGPLTDSERFTKDRLIFDLCVLLVLSRTSSDLGLVKRLREVTGLLMTDQVRVEPAGQAPADRDLRPVSKTLWATGRRKPSLCHCKQ